MGGRGIFSIRENFPSWRWIWTTVKLCNLPNCFYLAGIVASASLFRGKVRRDKKKARKGERAVAIWFTRFLDYRLRRTGESIKNLTNFNFHVNKNLVPELFKAYYIDLLQVSRAIDETNNFNNTKGYFLWERERINFQFHKMILHIIFSLCFHSSCEIWILFSRAPMRNFLC